MSVLSTDAENANLNMPAKLKFSEKKKKLITLYLSIILLGSAALIDDSEKVRQRRWWVKPWLLHLENGNIKLPQEFIEVDDTRSYQNFLRMDENTFNKLLKKIRFRIEKTSKYRECISARNKFLITLRYLATGESYRSLMYSFRVSESTISLFVPIVCQAIYDELKEYLHVPSTVAEWLNISKEFENLWNLPYIVGAMDGKHIIINAPKDQGSAYYNYKNLHSIVLLALVDANYNFLYINIGMNGRISDGGVFRESDLSNAIEKNTLNLPEDKPLPFRHKPVPYVIVADAGFPLSTHIMKPYPFKGMSKEQRIFNCRLSRVRRVVENTFGILANRFRILLNTNPLKPAKVMVITQACCALHNFLRKECKQYKSVNSQKDGDKTYTFLYGLKQQQRNRPKTEALAIRNEFKEYVNGCGSVPWQDDMI